VKEERRFETLQERLYALIENCDAAMALPGGVGTLAEIAVMWSQMQTQALPARPVILIGSGWRKVFDVLFAEMGGNISSSHRELLTFVKNTDEAVSMLKSK
jgi:predicted Rossmann-fold nucleotide-binding protein